MDGSRALRSSVFLVGAGIAFCLNACSASEDGGAPSGVTGGVVGGGGYPMVPGGGGVTMALAGGSATAGRGGVASGVGGAGSGAGGSRNAGGAMTLGSGGARLNTGGGASGAGSVVGAGGKTGAGGIGAGGKLGSGGAVGSGGALGTGGLPPIQGGTNGYATRFWDCCKPHCGWTGNVPGGTNPVTSCSQSNASLGSNYDAKSSCDNGPAYMCQGLAPWAVTDKVSYGYAATSNGDLCGRCYQLQFTGSSHNGGNDPGSQALNGKTMVVQAINIGSDVGGGQFDILTPGGGVGAFNACGTQWGVSASELGAQYGGFLSACQSQSGGNYSAAKNCVAGRCSSVFGSRGLTSLQAGCSWFVDWYQAADNPSLVYKEVTCPPEITNKSGLSRR